MKLALMLVPLLAIAASFTVRAETMRCPAGPIISPYADVKHWATSHGTFVDPEFLGEIVDQYCSSASQIVFREPSSTDPLHVTSADIDSVRTAVIADYLDSYADLTRTTRTMRAILRSHLGVSGFSRPVARTRGIVRVTYLRPIERMRLRGQDFDPWPRFFLLPGPASYAGVSGGRAVCRGQITITATTPAAVTC